MPQEQQSERETPVIIRKYANRRLYNTATAGFVTLDDLRQMVVRGEDFRVLDAQTGNDITASVLAQIVAEQETRGESLLPLALLKQAISFYEKGMGASFARYLEQSMSSFAQSLERMGELGEIGRRNLELFQRSFGMFAPMAGAHTAPKPPPEEPAPAPETEPPATAELRGQVEALKEELASLQRRLDALGDEGGPARTRRRKG